jgi:serine/threonine protein kinase
MSATELLDKQLVNAAFRKSLGDGAGVLLADEMRERWERGEEVDVLTLLAEHPEHAAKTGVIIDLTYEEYCLRLESNLPVDVEALVTRFPQHEHSLRYMIATRLMMERDLPRLAQTTDHLPWPRPGQNFAGFDLSRELGRGTFARVYLAREPLCGNRLVALKVTQVLGAEARTLGPLHHPNIVPLYSVQRDLETGFLAVCMPYLGGATLYDVTDRGFDLGKVPARASTILDIARDQTLVAVESNTGRPDPLLERCSYIDGVLHVGLQLTAALGYLHERSICHRDLKPSNVLLTTAGKPLLLDFNLALDRRSGDPLLGGTVSYMSPEQLRAAQNRNASEAKLIDGRTDIFALGVVLYELLTGTHPFGPIDFDLSEPKAVGEMLTRLQRRPWPLRRFNRGVDGQLAVAIERCLAWAPEDRPDTVARLAHDLQRCLSKPRKAIRWSLGHRLQTMAMAGGVAAVLMAGSCFLAAREPYAQRQLRAAEIAWKAGDPAAAFEAASLAADADPRSGRACFIKGLACEELNRPDEAAMNFAKAALLLDDGASQAYMGYFYARRRQLTDAVQCHERAMGLNFRTPEVLNNQAYCYLLLGQLETARLLLDEAITAAPRFQAAYHNLAVCDLMDCVSKPKVPCPIPKLGMADLEKAIAIGPASAALYVDLARLHAVSAASDPSYKAAALADLREAVQLGQNLQGLRQDGYLKSIQHDPKFGMLVLQSSTNSISDDFPRIVNPYLGDAALPRN